MTSPYLLRECRSEHEARTNVIRLRPIIPPPHPPEPTFEQRLQASVLALRDAFLPLMAALMLTGLCVYAVGFHEGKRMARQSAVVEVVPADQFAMYAFKGTYGE